MNLSKQGEAILQKLEVVGTKLDYIIKRMEKDRDKEKASAQGGQEDSSKQAQDIDWEEHEKLAREESNKWGQLCEIRQDCSDHEEWLKEVISYLRWINDNFTKKDLAAYFQPDKEEDCCCGPGTIVFTIEEENSQDSSEENWTPAFFDNYETREEPSTPDTSQEESSQGSSGRGSGDYGYFAY